MIQNHQFINSRVLALLVALLLTVAACGGVNGDKAQDETQVTQDETQVTQDETQVTETNGTGDAGNGEFAEPMAERMTLEEVNSELGPVPEPSGDYRIGAVLKTLINEHWQQMRQGFLDAGEEYGVEVVVQAAADESDLTGQLSVAENMWGQGFDVFSVSPLSQSNLDPFLTQVRNSGVPLLNVDDARVDARVFIGADHREMGVLAAETIVEMLPDGGKVAQIEGQAGSPAAQQRIDGFNSVMEGNPDFEYVASVPGDWDRATALDAATNLLQEYPDLVAFYANNDTMALGVVEAVRNAGREGEVIVIGTDGVPDALQSIADGQLTATVAVRPYQMGWTAVEIGIRLLEGQPVASWAVTDQVMVTAENVDEFIAK